MTGPSCALRVPDVDQATPLGRSPTAPSTRPGSRSFDVAAAPRDWTRRERVQLAQQLRRGLGTSDIARRLAVSPSTIRDYISDPDGEKARARQAKKPRGSCISCGGKTGPNRGKRVFKVCADCMPRLRAQWTRETTINAYLDWSERHSVEPTSTDWNRTLAFRRGGEAVERFSAGKWPSSSVIVRLFGNWGSFVAAAHDAVNSRACTADVANESEAERGGTPVR